MKTLFIIILALSFCSCGNYQKYKLKNSCTETVVIQVMKKGYDVGDKLETSNRFDTCYFTVISIVK